jgi:hypothetical protein
MGEGDRDDEEVKEISSWPVLKWIAILAGISICLRVASMFF